MAEPPAPDKSTGGISPPAEKSQQQTSDAQGQLTAAVDDLLDQLQHKFDAVSREMFTKLDDMTRRLDDLESSLTISADSAAATGSGSATPTPAK